MRLVCVTCPNHVNLRLSGSNEEINSYFERKKKERVKLFIILCGHLVNTKMASTNAATVNQIISARKYTISLGRIRNETKGTQTKKFLLKRTLRHVKQKLSTPSRITYRKHEQSLCVCKCACIQLKLETNSSVKFNFYFTDLYGVTGDYTPSHSPIRV